MLFNIKKKKLNCETVKPTRNQSSLSLQSGKLVSFSKKLENVILFGCDCAPCSVRELGWYSLSPAVMAHGGTEAAGHSECCSCVSY